MVNYSKLSLRVDPIQLPSYVDEQLLRDVVNCEKNLICSVELPIISLPNILPSWHNPLLP